MCGVFWFQPSDMQPTDWSPVEAQSPDAECAITDVVSGKVGTFIGTFCL